MEDIAKQEIPIAQENGADVKKIIMDQFVTSYHNLCANINRIPFAPQIKAIIGQNVDTAYLWAMEGFKYIDFNPPVPSQPSATNDVYVAPKGNDAA